MSDDILIADLCVQLSECICIRPGTLRESQINLLREKDYDQAPVVDGGGLLGLVDTEYLIELRRDGKALDVADPHVCDGNKRLDLYSRKVASLFHILDKLRSQRALMVVHEEYREIGDGPRTVLGLLTIADLNRQEMRTALYQLLASVESGLARILEQHIADPWEWIGRLSTEAQARVVGYWELAKRKGIDVGPVVALNLADLVNIAAKSPRLLDTLGFKSRSEFEKRTGCIPDLRNRIMHPVRPLILEHHDVGSVYETANALNKLRDMVNKKKVQAA